MHQTDDTLIRRSRLTGDVVVINQCDQDEYTEYNTEGGIARFFSTRQRGLTKSRNMAIAESRADICMLCDDDEVFVPDYGEKILAAYEKLPQADVIIFKMVNRPPSFADKVMHLKFPRTMKVSSWQISFRRQRLLDTGVRFDELLGAGTGNGAEEELKFLLDCEKAGLAIYYVPEDIASVGQEASTWFSGFTETFFENRGATTRYILGFGMASVYAVYYVIRKRNLFRDQLSPVKALRATFQGILDNKITKQSRELNTREKVQI
ncbi:MAG: glycosyltransferase family A protein [Faecousia sp.]